MENRQWEKFVYCLFSIGYCPTRKKQSADIPVWNAADLVLVCFGKALFYFQY